MKLIKFSRRFLYLYRNSSNFASCTCSTTIIRKFSTTDDNDGEKRLKLTKPGALGKAGETRKNLEEIGDEKKKKPQVLKKKDDNDGNSSDDELFSSSSSSSSSDDEKETEKPSHLLSTELRSAVKNVSKSLGGDEKKTRIDLLKKLMQHEKETYKASKIEENDDDDGSAGKEKGKEKETKKKSTSKVELGSILGAMKVQKEAPRMGRQTRSIPTKSADQVINRYRQLASQEDEGGDGAPIRKEKLADEPKQYPKTDFFDRGPGLGIFVPIKDQLKESKPPLLPVWENLERRRLKQFVTREPRSGFEELIRWTEEGRMHPYPIDNDYGHVEVNVPFHEHVFLEELLDDGFAKTGPIRHFMELVVHGLSSNPYMSVEKKRRHIAWFREYFQKRGAEIEKLHALDLKHQQTLREMETASGQSASGQPQATSS